jgi:hypothetical protein
MQDPVVDLTWGSQNNFKSSKKKWTVKTKNDFFVIFKFK